MADQQFIVWVRRLVHYAGKLSKKLLRVSRFQEACGGDLNFCERMALRYPDNTFSVVILPTGEEPWQPK